nr:hypothetical protein Iba_scaffold36823CG0010 [Ipomoea batatas]GMD46711.1 hypothetical protein Iba_chr10eCG5930 [Ipomoea batatas]
MLWDCINAYFVQFSYENIHCNRDLTCNKNNYTAISIRDTVRVSSTTHTPGDHLFGKHSNADGLRTW